MTTEHEAPFTPPRPVQRLDRAVDALALALLAGGTGLFLFARRALGQLARGAYHLPAGVTWVSRAELHDLQARVGWWVAGAGLVVAALAAARHALRRAGR